MRSSLEPIAVRRARHGARDAALLTLGLGVSSAFGYVVVASSQTRRRIRECERRYGVPRPARLV